MFVIYKDIASLIVFSECLFFLLSLVAAEVSENLKSLTALEKELMGSCVSYKSGVNFKVNL